MIAFSISRGSWTRGSELRSAWDSNPIPLFTLRHFQAFDLTGQVQFAGGEYAANYAATGEVYDITNDAAPTIGIPTADQVTTRYFLFVCNFKVRSRMQTRMTRFATLFAPPMASSCQIAAVRSQS